ncbi:MAG TPA: dienelactone hydrolase family protein [Holophagaceae bacterium]|nr:dienelactone hydrolase family protein [Holophagaceae bacterium]
MAETRTLRTDTTGRYLVEPGPDNAPLLVGFHGYGQNAETLLTDLRRIPGAARWTLVSVEALHRFYNRSQKVVASWMTSQDREAAIADNLAYVDRVLAELGAEGHEGKLVFAGFSQGAAMAWRAAAHIPCDGLIVLGGDLPKDVAEAPQLTPPPILLGHGDQDIFYSAEQFTKDLEVLDAHGVRPEVCRFDSGHEWHAAFLDAAGHFLEQVRA